MLGIILSKYVYREADQLVSIFTPLQGKIQCIARGSRKSTSKNAAALEVGSCVEFGTAEGKEFFYLTSVCIEAYYPVMRSTFLHAQAALLVCDIIHRFTQEGEKDLEVFTLLKNFLDRLNEPTVLSLNELDEFFQQFLVQNGLLEANKERLEHETVHRLMQSSFEQKVPNWSNLWAFVQLTVEA